MNNRKFSKAAKYLTFASALGLAAYAAPALAQAADSAAAQAGAASSDGIILVTAQRREQSIQDVPVSMVAISGDALADQNITSFIDLAAQVPNMIVNQSASSDQFHLRGFGAGFNSGFEQAVATFVDGAYRTRSRSSRVALFDVEQVEVLRGPQSLYFGANAIAGALNITTRKPGDEVEVNATALYAVPDGEYNLEAGLSLPIAEGLSVRVAGRAGGMDGYIYNRRFDTDGPHQNTRQTRASLAFESGDFELNARYDWARVRNDGTQYEAGECPPSTGAPAGMCAGALAQFPDLDNVVDGVTDQGTNGVSNLDFDEGVINARYNFAGVSLVSTTAITEQFADVASEVIPLPGLSVVGTPSWLPAAVQEGFHQISQELRLESTATGMLSYMVGGYFEDNRTEIRGLAGNYFLPFAVFPPVVGLIPPDTRIISVTDSTIKGRTWSGFASLTVRPIDDLTLTGGLRYSHVTKTGVRSAMFGSGGFFDDADRPFVEFNTAASAASSALLAISQAPYNQAELVNDAWMPSVKVQYDFNPELMAYASYSRGFLAGGFGMNTPDVFLPETADAFEAGLKYQSSDRRFTANIAVFNSTYDNLQEAYNNISPSGTTQLLIANVASSRSRGVELGVRYKVTDSLTLHTDLAYLDSKYLSYPDAPCNPLEAAAMGNPCSVDASGRRRAYAPETSGSFGADYVTDITNDLELGLHANVMFTSEFYAQTLISDLVNLPGYAKLDARISLASSDSWQVQVIGRNLFDKRNEVYRSYMPAALGSIIAEVDRGRSVALQLSLNF